jgi:hypothetical protein
MAEFAEYMIVGIAKAFVFLVAVIVFLNLLILAIFS